MSPRKPTHGGRREGAGRPRVGGDEPTLTLPPVRIPESLMAVLMELVAAEELGTLSAGVRWLLEQKRDHRA